MFRVGVAAKLCEQRTKSCLFSLAIVSLRRAKRENSGRNSVFISHQNAEAFVASLHLEERLRLRKALQMDEKTLRSKDGPESDTATPTGKQLRLVALHNAVPFAGFGFLDNAIMIIAGEYIDLTIGMTLGISTMAAAALGNIVSDVSGIGLAHYVEAATNKLGFEGPNLSSKQSEMPRTRFVTNLGRAAGIITGCLLGMFPLLFYVNNDEKGETEGKDKEQVATTVSQEL